ncbi:hypothetical protein AB6Q20_005385 [Salmonella enterica]
MTESRENELSEHFQQLRQFPLDPARLRKCKMTSRQAERIRDMDLASLAREETVTAEEFAYITGRTRKVATNLIDRNQVDVVKEKFPGAKRAKRFIDLQSYWFSMRNCRSIVTPEEKEWLRHLMKTDAAFRRTINRVNNNAFRQNHYPGKARQQLNQEI